MDNLEEGAVQAMVAQLHRAYCLPGASRSATWTLGHFKGDERKARSVLGGLETDSSLVLVPTWEASR